MLHPIPLSYGVEHGALNCTSRWALDRAPIVECMELILINRICAATRFSCIYGIES